MMRIDNDNITERLDAIRRQIGGRKVPFTPRPPQEEIDVEVEEALAEMFHPSGLLVKNGRPVFAYIRDHTGGGGDKYNLRDPTTLKKIHFTVCRTLRKMQRKGRWERYRVTNCADDKYAVDVKRGGGNISLYAKLYPCQFCLSKVAYHCFDLRTTPKKKRRAIVSAFNAKEAMALLWLRFDLFKRATADLAPATRPAGYAANHKAVSRRYRSEQNFTCEECGVNLKNHKRLTDMHHINSVKEDNAPINLQCLCKICHGEKHPHYRVSAADRATIERLRQQAAIR